MQAPVQRQTEPSVSLFAPDPTRMKGFAPITRRRGRRGHPGATCRPGELYLNEKGADTLHVRAGDPLLVFVGAKPVRMRIRAIVRFDGAGTADSALLLPLVEAQRLYGKPGRVIEGILISNRGDGDDAVALTDAGRRRAEADRRLRSASRPLPRSRTRSTLADAGWATPSWPSSRPSAPSRSPPGSCSSS